MKTAASQECASGRQGASLRQRVAQQEQSEEKREGPEDQQALLILSERIGAQTVSLHQKGCSLAKAPHCFPSRTAAMHAGAPARGIALRRRAPSTCPPCPTLPPPECAPGSPQSPPPAAAWTQTASFRRRTWGTASPPAGSARARAACDGHCWVDTGQLWCRGGLPIGRQVVRQPGERRHMIPQLAAVSM